MGRIGKIYRIERELRAEELEAEEFLRKREELVLPILKKFKEWLEKKSLQVPPSTLLGKAVNYALKEWEKLLKYLDSPYLTPDTNLVLCSGYYNPQDSDKSFGGRANHGVAA